jgi:hypothetical protein
MNKDGVAAAFELIIEEIESVADKIADQGSEAFREKNYDAAQRLGESGKNLLAFLDKVQNLLEDWQRGIDVATRQRFSSSQPQKKRTPASSQRKAQKTVLRVKFDDGTVIEEHYAADTFALALQRMGLDRVSALGITECGIPLVGGKKDDQYNQRIIDGRYICTHSNTQKKKVTLEKIAESFKMSLKVEIL